jgi:predicted transcriptional regulator of viral defense system
MKHKNVTILSSKLLTGLAKEGKDWFTLKDVYQMLTCMSEDSARRQLSRMVEAGLLLRVKEGAFYIIPFEQDSESFLPDWHLLAEPLVGDKYYIGYYSALQIHNLITQPSLKEQIVVNKQIKPSFVELKGCKFQFIYHNSHHFFGSKKTWIDSYHRVMCSDLEKTFIDCLYKPEYAGGIIEIAKAIYMARDKINDNRLLEYALKFDVQAVIKRLGYLLELLSIETPIIDKLQKVRTDSITILDTEVPKQGKIMTRWSILQNIDINTIQSAITT